MIKRGNAIDFSRLFGSIAFISFLSNNTGLVGKNGEKKPTVQLYMPENIPLYI